MSQLYNLQTLLICTIQKLFLDWIRHLYFYSVSPIVNNLSKHDQHGLLCYNMSEITDIQEKFTAQYLTL